MSAILNTTRFLIKERPVWFRARNCYDICDPETGRLLLECREDHLGPLAKVLRYTGLQRLTPFEIDVREPGKRKIFSIQRGWGLFVGSVAILDESSRPMGRYDRKALSLQDVSLLDAEGKPVCRIGGSWIDEVKFIAPDGSELGSARSTSRGPVQDALTSLRDYELKINANVPADHLVRRLLIAAVICLLMAMRPTDSD